MVAALSPVFGPRPIGSTPYAHRVGSAADARDDVVRVLAGHVEELLPGLDADDALEIAYHHRERVGADDRAYAVDARYRVGHVRLESGVDGLLERPEPAGHGHDRGAQYLHPGDVRRFLLDIYLAHVYLALEPEVRRRRRERDAVLAGARLGYQPFLAQVLGQQGFAHAVVELVRACMVQVLALQVDTPSAFV
jgi:hypothetical protein